MYRKQNLTSDCPQCWLGYSSKSSYDAQRELNALFISANGQSIFSKPSYFDYQSILKDKEKYGLREGMSEGDIQNWILKKIQNFHEKFYSADLMSLTIIDSRPIPIIQEMVETYFRKLPKRRSLDRVTTSGELILPFSKELLGKVVKYKTSSKN